MGDMPDVSLLGIMGLMGGALVFIVRQQMSTIEGMIKGIMERPDVCPSHEAMAKNIEEQGKDIEELKVSTARIDVRTEEIQKRIEAIAGNGLSH